MFSGELNPALQGHGIGPGSHVFYPFAKDRLRENGRSRGAVAGLVVGFHGDFAHHLRAHVLVLVLQLNLLGDGYAVLGDYWWAKLLAQNDVAALWSQRHPHCVRERVHTLKHRVARFFSKLQLFCRHSLLSFYFSSSTIIERLRRFFCVICGLSCVFGRAAHFHSRWPQQPIADAKAMTVFTHDNSVHLGIRFLRVHRFVPLRIERFTNRRYGFNARARERILKTVRDGANTLKNRFARRAFCRRIYRTIEIVHHGQ